MADLTEHTFTDNGEWIVERPIANRTDFRTLAYEGDLGGGTLQLFTTIGTVTAPVPDSKLAAGTVDDNGDAIKSYPFRTAGEIKVVLSGATAPNVTVAVL